MKVRVVEVFETTVAFVLSIMTSVTTDRFLPKRVMFWPPAGRGLVMLICVIDGTAGAAWAGAAAIENPRTDAISVTAEMSLRTVASYWLMLISDYQRPASDKPRHSKFTRITVS